MGDFARAQGQMDDAAEAYETSVSYARQVRQTRGDDESAELLAGSLSGVGDVAEAEGRLDAALAAFEEALALRRSRRRPPRRRRPGAVWTGPCGDARAPERAGSQDLELSVATDCVSGFSCHALDA